MGRNERILGCTRIKRQRWTKEGKLKVAYRRYLNIPFYDIISLYESIDKADNLYFCDFHYPTGKDFLPNPEELPLIEHKKQDGIFRYDRTLFDVEKIVYTEEFIGK